MKFQPKKLAGNVLLAIASVAITCIAIIAIDRAAGWLSPATPFDRGLLFAPYSAAHYDTLEFKCTVRMNNLGFRGDDTTIEKSRRTRIVALGDSFTYGWGVELTDTWVKQVESALRAEGNDVEILNLGVPGHGPGEYADTAERVVPILKPDIVLVGLLQGNDLEQIEKWKPKKPVDDAATPLSAETEPSPAIKSITHRLVPNLSRISARFGIGLSGKPTSIADQWKKQTLEYVDTMSEADRHNFYTMSDFLRLGFMEGRLNPAALTWLFPATDKAPKNTAAKKAPAQASNTPAPNSDLNSELMRRRIDRCAEQLERIRYAAEQNGARVVVLSIPESSYVGLSGWHLLFERRLSDEVRKARDANFVTTVPDEAHELACKRANVPLVHVTAAYRKESAEIRCFYEFDGHFTPDGNRLFADLLTPALRPYLR